MRSQPVALVTGATSGIGEAIAYRMHAEGYVVFAAGRNPTALDALRDRGLQARALDVTDQSAVSRLVDEIDAEYGAVDVLVNSAGIPFGCPLEQTDVNEVRQLFETHVVALIHLSQAVLPGMRARGAGTIVNIGSTAGRYTVPGACAYHITKYGVEALSLSLRAEVAQFGVHVVLIDPTAVRTPFIEGHINEQRSYADDDPYAAFKRRHHEVIARLAKTPGLTIGADTVARVVLQVVKAKNPKPRYIVGLSGKATIWARALLTDRMWERIVLSGLEP